MGSRYHRQTADTEKLSDDQIIVLAHELVEAFLEFIREDTPGNDILDVKALPTRKTSIENAFRLVIATEENERVRRRLSTAGMVLANFQDGIGPRVSLVPASAEAPASCDDDDRVQRVQQRLDRIFARVDADVTRLRTVFDQSNELAKRRFTRLHATPPFQEDGTYTWHGHH
ncbi:hypothetical protein E2F50_14575 [Rhizobium deserti]|uniref:Uncharacterized protein n=1 Tax=Rhizobium deserti TaxID=2547961 RepID=A0A4R5UHL2_9HYPH|nr:hypothetical protein [Rhizobium deserti]TDK35461.1 hypothetical protein E2F50_14575 [Rhizobium deserti]